MHNAQELVADYLAHGWSLVPVPPGQKGPRASGWNQRGAALKSLKDLPPNYGVGLGHAYSGTMAFDIDEWDLTKSYGIDVDALYAAEDAVVIHSGKEGHGKLLYKMPFGLVLPSKKVHVNRRIAFELRCGTADGNLTVQDVLPPSIHPETKQPYQWAGQGHWSRLPLLPPQLLQIWQTLLSEPTGTVTVEGMDASWDEIRSALGCIPPDCSRDQWIEVGMALHFAGAKTGQMDEAFVVWDEWSQGSRAKYPGERETAAQWRSFRTDRGTPVTLGTLYHLAREGGWVRPLPDVASYFASVQATAPEDIAQGLRPKPPEMDLALWPGILRTRAEEISRSVGCDPLVPLFAGLAAVCGVIDAQTRLELMPGFKVPPVLWLMTIGDPADKKSPGSRPMLAPLKTIELEDRPRHARAVLDWEAQEVMYANAHKAFLEFAGSAEASLKNTVPPEVPTLPPKPAHVKITVSDVTSQKLVHIAKDRPRGLLCSLDEMNSWVRKLVDKSSGEDRSAWVVSYESEPYEMDRIGAGSVHCDNLAVSIYGNIQPRVYRESIAALSADGLLQRFIPGILRQDKNRLGEPIPDFMSHADQWENTLRMIFALPPMTYRLNGDAYRAYREFQRWYEDAKQDERLVQAGDVYMTAFGKLEGLVGRVALLWHVIEQPFNPVVDPEMIRRVVKFVRSYLIPAYRYAFGELGGASIFESWLTDHVIQYSDMERMTIADIKRSGRRQLEGMGVHTANQMILEGMYVLEQAKWLVRVDDGSQEHRGRAEWAVNPILKDLFRAHREKVILARQRSKESWAYYGPVQSEIRPRAHGLDDVEGV